MRTRRLSKRVQQSCASLRSWCNEQGRNKSWTETISSKPYYVPSEGGDSLDSHSSDSRTQILNPRTAKTPSSKSPVGHICGADRELFSMPPSALHAAHTPYGILTCATTPLADRLYCVNHHPSAFYTAPFAQLPHDLSALSQIHGRFAA